MFLFPKSPLSELVFQNVLYPNYFLNYGTKIGNVLVVNFCHKAQYNLRNNFLNIL